MTPAFSREATVPDKVRELGEGIASASIAQLIFGFLRIVTPTALLFLLGMASSIHSDLNTLQTEVRVMTTQNQHLLERVVRLESDNRPLGGVLATIQAQISEIRSRLDTQRRDIDRLRDEVP